ncbi:bifunctional 2-polyprenyl-6-hydroxyphenol methylase/3-demethylubiquinol 3-O-methyltransferase UbiG [Algoriphagus sp.]|uniref:class I SAM-dependent methyltransferase n=1 Tax=Algoriphagus sp. TaxID=1872435 RepID=UPI00271B0273|nr:class I SAM-dependent methyltransferase [Algoriphagus sp.]MDO8966434.1 class I SAM-dependent methyltransferase [Algoriphagus sp.]MDP3201880.1 class I SAM-dependent methyltransferase [Algoriphagus sp.]
MSKCKFCGSSDLRFFQAKERMLGLGGNFSYAECISCESLQLDSIPADLSSYYPADYYSFAELKKSNPIARLLKKFRMRVFLRFGIRWLSPVFGYWLVKFQPGFSDRIADVGCGNGQLLYELHAAGFTDLQGFDPFIAEDTQIAPGLCLWKKRIEESEVSFDWIMMHHSFEHMEDPEDVLKSCYEKLKPGGKLLIRCPVADSEVWKESREFWVQLDAPRHLIIPTLKGLKIKAEQLGFVLDEVAFDSTDFQFWGTELYRRGELLDESKTAAFLTKDVRSSMQEKALLYNQEGKGDQACFYLRKPIKA